MTWLFPMVVLKSLTNDNGVIEYYLFGLFYWDDFELVVLCLEKFNVEIIEKVDGIFFRYADVKKEGIAFKIMFHEDLGLYCYLLETPSKQTYEWLQNFLEQVVIEVNHRLAQNAPNRRSIG